MCCQKIDRKVSLIKFFDVDNFTFIDHSKKTVPQNRLQNLLLANTRAVTIEHRRQKQHLKIHL